MTEPISPVSSASSSASSDRTGASLPFCSLAGRVAVVTGASSGIGAAIAVEFARAGAAVVVHCRRNLAGAEKTVREIAAVGSRGVVVCADLSVSPGLDRFVDAAWGCLGPVSIWVNNAGVDLLTSPDKRRQYSEKLQLLFETDVRSTLLLTRAVGQKMRSLPEQNGVILNIGWDQAERGMEGDSGELFAASKSAIMGASRSAACSLAPDVRVNCIAPGWIRTAWGETAPSVWQQRVISETPMKRWGTPTDIAVLARFLASDSANYLTGQVINCNGGAVR